MKQYFCFTNRIVFQRKLEIIAKLIKLGKIYYKIANGKYHIMIIW